MLEGFNSIFQSIVGVEDEVEVQDDVMSENTLDESNIPVVYNFDDLLRLKNLPIRFDKQDHKEPSLRYRYNIETKEDYQLSSTSLIENGKLQISYNCADFDVNDEEMPIISIVWEFDPKSLKLIPKRIEKM